MTTPAEVTASYARIWNAGDFETIRDVAHDDFTFRGAHTGLDAFTNGVLPMNRAAVVTDKVASPVGPFSVGVHDRDAVYTSGHVAQDPLTGRLVDGDITRQTEQVFQNLEAVLGAGGKTFGDVVKTSVFLTDMRDFPGMNAVYAKHFQAPYPARTTVAVAALPLGAIVEIDVIAR